jgi:hypothetical protein
MKKSLNKSFYILGLIFFAGNSWGQSNFNWQAKLDSVKTAGSYQINLQPFLTACLQPDLRDVRILDVQGNMVPYIIRSDLPSFKETDFSELPILSNQKGADKQTHIVIENKNKGSLQELLLLIKNTEASRYVSLSGSEDSVHWFVIKENIFLNKLFTADTDRLLQSIDFPVSNYRYFEITILGKNVLPVNILKVGIYENSFINGQYLTLPNPGMIQKDSNDKCTYIMLQFNKHYFIDRIELDLEGSKYFKRRLEIFSGVIGNSRLLTAEFISSGKPIVLNPDIKSNHLLIKIHNEDNPPLHVIGIRSFQLNRYLLCYLENGKQYRIVCGDSSATVPSYDLVAFKDSISSNAAVIQHGKLEKINTIIPAAKKAATNTNVYMWLAIGVACIILLLLTIGLTKEINKRKA